MADYCPAGPRLKCRIGIEDSYGSCRCATVVIAETGLFDVDEQQRRESVE